MGIDHYAYTIYGVKHELSEPFLELYNAGNVDYSKLPVVFDEAYGDMYVGLVIFETQSITESGEYIKNMVVDPENVAGLLKARDKYKSAFVDSFPDYENLLE